MVRFILTTLVVLNILCALAYWLVTGAEPEVASAAPVKVVAFMSLAAARPEPTMEPAPVEAAPAALPALAPAMSDTATEPTSDKAAPASTPVLAPVLTATAPEATPVDPIPTSTPVLAPAMSDTAPEPTSDKAAPASTPVLAPAAPDTTTEPTLVEAAPASSPAAAVPGALPATPPTDRRAALQPPKPQAATAVTVVNGSELPAKSITVLSDARAVSHAGPLAPKAKATLKLPKMKGCLVTVAATFEGGSVSDGRTIDVCRVKLVRLTD